MDITVETSALNTAIGRTEREIALMQEYRTRLSADSTAEGLSDEAPGRNRGRRSLKIDGMHRNRKRTHAIILWLKRHRSCITMPVPEAPRLAYS